MDQPSEDKDEESIGALIGRLVEDGRSYAEAELELLKAVARHRAVRARRAAIALGIGLYLLVSSFTALLIGLVLGFSQYMNPFFAGLVVTTPLAAIGYLLLSRGLAGFRTLGRDPEEQAALDRAERP